MQRCMAAGLALLALIAQPVQARTVFEPLPDSAGWDAAAEDGGAALRAALAATPWPDGPPLLEGWISPNIYTRLFPGQQVYFVLREPPLADVRAMCRVTVDRPPTPGINHDAMAGLARLGAHCRERTTDDTEPYSAERFAPGPAGGPQAQEQSTLQLADGTVLHLQHLTNVGYWHTPLPSGVSWREVTMGRMPLPRALTRQPADAPARTDRFTYVRNARGEWGLAIHFDHGNTLGASGCFITAPAERERAPTAAWLAGAVLEWCLARQISHAASAAARPVPMAPPRPAVGER